MAGKKKNEDLNEIKAATAEANATSLLLAIYLNVDPTTVSKWNTNSSQPSLAILDRAGDFLETDNRNLVTRRARKKTGLAEAAQNELKRLMESGVNPYQLDENGKPTKKLNPEMVTLIQDFVKKYQEKHSKD
ncbi:hypothetical protein [Olivibacter oleidegradans]|uniref:Uncharacterized protein n=1 Tax=Olivibacter oleidegradans TaxID=760123 RepID=A0ABV6HDJ2_9SPHI